MTQDKNGGAERRTEIRIPKSYRVEICEFKYPTNRQKCYEVQTADVSAGGLKVDAPVRFDKGAKVLVKIFIPSLNKYHPSFFKVFESDVGQYFQAISEVVWVEDRIPLLSYLLGLRFNDYDQDDWTALRNLISKSAGPEQI